MKSHGERCPHCGNKDKRTIESNLAPDERKRFDTEETLLCMNPVKPADCTFSDDKTYTTETDANGLVACGMQWDPREELS